MSSLTPTKTLLKDVSVHRLVPYAKNPRQNDKAIAGVMQSLQTYGYIKPSIIVDENMVLLAGHTTLKALKRIGWDCVPEVIQVTGLDEMQKRGYRIADNKTAEAAEWDIDLLLGEMKDLDMDGYDVTLTGFSKYEVDQLMGGIGNLLAEEELPPPPPKPRILSPAPETRRDMSDDECFAQATQRMQDDGDISDEQPMQLGGSCNAYMPGAATRTIPANQLGGMPVSIHKPLDISLHFNTDREREIWEDYIEYLKEAYPDTPSIAAKIVADIQNRSLW
jgi:hypothetical protein